MYTSLVDKMDFLETHIGAMVDEYHEEDGVLSLSNGSFVVMDDVKCVHHYRVGDLEETSDMSVDYRNYMISKFKNMGDKYALTNYCRKCIVAIEEEYLKVVEKCVHPESQIDYEAYREQADMLNAQANDITIILSHESESESTM